MPRYFLVCLLAIRTPNSGHVLLRVLGTELRLLVAVFTMCRTVPAHWMAAPLVDDIALLRVLGTELRLLGAVFTI